jgi:hypothetical protein
MQKNYDTPVRILVKGVGDGGRSGRSNAQAIILAKFLLVCFG